MGRVCCHLVRDALGVYCVCPPTLQTKNLRVKSAGPCRSEAGIGYAPSPAMPVTFLPAQTFLWALYQTLLQLLVGASRLTGTLIHTDIPLLLIKTLR